MLKVHIAIVVGVMGAIAAVVLTIGLVWFCIFWCKNPSNRNSETGSSEPSAPGALRRGRQTGSTGASISLASVVPRQFTMDELEQSTRRFDEANLIGQGSFGPVYKGLLHDGSIVAIKRRNGAPSQELIEEVTYLSEIHHRHLVTLLGYCQDKGMQMLVFEYVPNGSISGHLYESGPDSKAKLEFRQRLSIALGAAKGLSHLHSQERPIVHGNFKTTNILVDENFTAKVADAGISRLLQRIENSGPSSRRAFNIFHDPEVEESDTFSTSSDVYSYGIFLLELVTGREVQSLISAGDTIIQCVKTRLSRNEFVDSRLVGGFTAAGMRETIRLMLLCTSFPGRSRPRMEMVVAELDRILENEVAITTGVHEGTTTTVTLASELFSS